MARTRLSSFPVGSRWGVTPESDRCQGWRISVLCLLAFSLWACGPQDNQASDTEPQQEVDTGVVMPDADADVAKDLPNPDTQDDLSMDTEPVPVDSGSALDGEVTVPDTVSGDTTSKDSVPDVPPDTTGETDDGVTPPQSSCDGVAICDDFETSSAGAAPDEALWEVVAPNCSGDGTITVDNTVARSGVQSVRVESSGGYCNHVFLAPTASVEALGSVIYGRFYVRFEEALGMQHITFLAMKDAQQNKDLRMGGQSEILMWNRETDDATLPSLSPKGISLSVKPSAKQWLCVEFKVDGAAGTLDTWIDGALVEGLVVDDTPTPDVDTQWHNMPWSPQLTDAKFGWESYGNIAANLWFDDIALDTAPIGCQ